MLEFALVSLVISIFFLYLYTKLKTHEREFETANPNQTTTAVEKLNKISCFVFAIMAFVIAFFFAMLGSPTITETAVNTYVNFTGNSTVALLNSTTTTTLQSYTTNQQNFINSIYTLMQYTLFMFGLAQLIVHVMKFFKGIQDQWDRKQRGEYDE